jgi:hypothetical protein
MSLQGYIEDAVGQPLGSATPTNYVVRFSIFKAPQGGTATWSETQTVTFDKGNYSVLLGQGTPDVAGAVLSDVLITNKIDLYVETTVTITGQNSTTIKPRLRLIPTPYAFVAKTATTAEKITGTLPTTQLTGTLTTSQLGPNSVETATIKDGAVTSAKITGPLTPSQLGVNSVATATIQNGAVTSAKITGPLDATQIPNLPASKINSGTLDDALLPATVARTSAANNFTGNQTINGSLTATNIILGNNALVSGTGNQGLRIVWGVRERGGALQGPGWSFQGPFVNTPHLNANSLKVIFNPPFSSSPAITVNSIDASGASVFVLFSKIWSITNSEASFSFSNLQGVGSDMPFSFIAVGPR